MKDTELILNYFDSEALFEQFKAAGKMKPNQLYLIAGGLGLTPEDIQKITDALAEKGVGGLPNDALQITKIDPGKEDDLLALIEENGGGMYYCTSSIDVDYASGEYAGTVSISGLIDTSYFNIGGRKQFFIAVFNSGKTFFYEISGIARTVSIESIDLFGDIEAAEFGAAIDSRIDQRLAELDGSEVYY